VTKYCARGRTWRWSNKGRRRVGKKTEEMRILDRSISEFFIRVRQYTEQKDEYKKMEPEETAGCWREVQENIGQESLKNTQ
jgi:hypothetical protein